MHRPVCDGRVLLHGVTKCVFRPEGNRHCHDTPIGANRQVRKRAVGMER